jgi:GNAT superfamily N-acetyltransferase
MATHHLKYEPLTSKNWAAFEKLFGQNGACGGCWCMLWRLKRSVYEDQKGEQNKLAMLDLVNSGKEPGIIAFLENEPVGWCALSKRDDYPALERSRILKKVDDLQVWSIACFFIAKEFRNQGISIELLKFTIDYCKKKGASIIEGYPVEPKNDKMPAVFAWTGIASAYLKAGFIEVARRSETRPIMRFVIKS